MSEIAEKNARKLTPFDRRSLQRDLAAAEATRAALARKYGVTRGYITQFANQYSREIAAIRADIDNEFAGLWIADKENRIVAYQQEYALAASDGRAAHHEWIKTRALILRQVAEELGQLPTRATTAIIVPVVHVVEGVDLDALR